MNKQNRLTKFFERNLIPIVILALAWVLIAPILLTQEKLSIVSFSETGQIGDTIGGITAPAIGLISAILLYLALVKQIESNNANKHGANFSLIYSEIAKFETEVAKYEFNKMRGKDALGELAAHFSFQHKLNLLKNSDYETLSNFNLLLTTFDKLLYLMDNLETSPEYNILLTKDIQNFFRINYGTSHEIIKTWEVNESDLNEHDWSLYMMFQIKRNILALGTDINNRNNKN